VAGDLLQQLETDVKAAGYTIHTPYVSLDTPGKATVQVVILQDPDGHEVGRACLVQIIAGRYGVRLQRGGLTRIRGWAHFLVVLCACLHASRSD
jgi:hypothetical protein